MYDIDMFARTMKNVLSEYDSYSISIPKIPMFAPRDNVLKITSSDVDKIMSYLDLTIEEIHNALMKGDVTPIELAKEATKRAKADNCNSFEYI